MTSQTPRPERPPRADGGATRTQQRAREMRERAEVAMAYEDGVVVLAEGQAAPEESPYERIFTGGDTVIPKPQPLHLDTAKVILIGIAVWAVALLVFLFVPALHTGSRHWWPWTCVAGMALGVLGWAYVRRGRGNAAAA